MRPRLLGGLIATVGVSLFVLFPSPHLFEKLSEHLTPDAVSIAYLRASVAEHPDDGEIRLKLSRQYLALGQFDDALAILDPLYAEASPFAQAARMQALRIRVEIWRALPVGDPQRPPQRDQLVEGLRPVMRPRPGLQDAKDLLSLALELGQPSLAGDLAAGLAETEPARRELWLAEAGGHFLASGQPDPAAEAFARAALAAQDPGDALRHARHAMDLLPAVKDSAGALRIATDLLQRFPNDPALLDAGVALALARERLPLAQQWMRQHLALSPGDLEVLARALDLELAAGDLRAALKLAQRIVALHPSSAAHRARLATLAGWAGTPRVALPQWVWIGERTGSDEAVDKALQLARGLYDAPTQARMLLLREQRGTLPNRKLGDLVRVLEDVGEPLKAERVLRAHLDRSPGLEGGLELLAGLQERQGHLAEALATREELSRARGLAVPDAIKQAELLWRLDRPREALERLRGVRARATGRDAAYWSLYGDLAWLLSEDAEALAAYQALRRGGRRDRASTERLLRLAIECGDPGLALAVGRESFEELGDPALLLSGAEAVLQVGSWKDVRRTLAIADARPKLFSPEARYWRLSALLAEHDGRLKDALASTEKALEIAPGDASTRQLALRLLIRLEDRQGLLASLERWEADAGGDPSYFRGYASALEFLGRRAEARRWLERLLERTPGDPLLLLEYADALDPSKEDEIRERRMRALQLLRPTQQWALSHGKAGGEGTWAALAFVDLEDKFEGERAAAPWVDLLLAQAGDSAAVQDWAIAWFIRRREFAPAHTWMDRKRAAGRPAPAWQRLQLALAEDDRTTVAELVDHPPADLSLADRFFAARHLGRDVAAWKLGREGMKAHPEIASALSPQLRALDEQLTDVITVAGRGRSLGWLGVAGVEAEARTARLFDGVLSARAAYRTIQASGAPAHLDPGGREVEGSVRVAFGQERWRTRLALGANGRTGSALPTALASQELGLGDAVTARLELAVNELSEDTAALRLIGIRSRLSASLGANLGSGGYGQLTAGVRQYSTRAQEDLGQGAGVEAEVGQRFRPWGQEVRVRGTGTWFLHPRSGSPLPERLAAFVAAEGVDQLLPPWYANAGVGVVITNGEPSEVGASSLRYVAEAWSGWVFSAQQVGY